MHGVPETMLQTLYARAAYSKKRKAKFCDDKAVEIEEPKGRTLVILEGLVMYLSEDVKKILSMKAIMPVYYLFGWIPAVKNVSNKLVVLRKE